MDDNNLKILTDGGVDVEEALERFGGSEQLFIKVLNKFLNDTNFNTYTEFLSKGDIVNAERSIHALKGIAGNLGINDVYNLSAEIDSGLKEGAVPTPEQDGELRTAYEKAVAAIKEFNGTK